MFIDRSVIDHINNVVVVYVFVAIVWRDRWSFFFRVDHSSCDSLGSSFFNDQSATHNELCNHLRLFSFPPSASDLDGYLHLALNRSRQSHNSRLWLRLSSILLRSHTSSRTTPKLPPRCSGQMNMCALS
jgi:hypothetical protein